MIYLVSMFVLAAVFFLAYQSVSLGSAVWDQERLLIQEFGDLSLVERYARIGMHFTGKYLRRLNNRPELVRYLDKVRIDNIAAGVPWGFSAEEILALGEMLFILAAPFTWLFMLFTLGSLNLFTGLVIASLFALAPGYMIGQKAVARRVQINRKLPFALDLLILCMEAGSGFLESIEILVTSNPEDPISNEFELLLKGVRYGSTRQQALVDMAERVRSNDLTPIVHALNTGEEMGTPTGDILRLQAQGIRARRSQRAEKLAAEASSKILFPTLLIMVAVLLMLMGPVIIKGVRGDWFQQ